MLKRKINKTNAESSKNRQRFSIIIFLFVLLILSGCSRSPLMIRGIITSDLEERYGKNFDISSLYKEGDAYYAICHPKDDKSLNFKCMYDSEGEFVFDHYIGAVISRKNTELFKEEIGTELGEVFIYESPDFGVHDDTDNIDVICDSIKNDTSEYEKYFAWDGSQLFFYIIINKSCTLYEYDPVKEYEVIKRAADKIINLYYDEYGVKIHINMHIFFCDQKDFDYSLRFFKNHTISNGLLEIHVDAQMIQLDIGDTESGYPRDARMTVDQYVEEREKIYGV